jgi:hypothetical protein
VAPAGLGGAADGASAGWHHARLPSLRPPVGEPRVGRKPAGGSQSRRHRAVVPDVSDISGGLQQRVGSSYSHVRGSYALSEYVTGVTRETCAAAQRGPGRSSGVAAAQSSTLTGDGNLTYRGISLSTGPPMMTWVLFRPIRRERPTSSWASTSEGQCDGYIRHVGWGCGRRGRGPRVRCQVRRTCAGAGVRRRVRG